MDSCLSLFALRFVKTRGYRQAEQTRHPNTPPPTAGQPSQSRRGRSKPQVSAGEVSKRQSPSEDSSPRSQSQPRPPSQSPKGSTDDQAVQTDLFLFLHKSVKYDLLVRHLLGFSGGFPKHLTVTCEAKPPVAALAFPAEPQRPTSACFSPRAPCVGQGSLCFSKDRKQKCHKSERK